MLWLQSLIATLFALGHTNGQVDPPVLLSNPEFLELATSEMMVIMREPLTPILRDLAAKTFGSRAARLNAVATALKAATAVSQAPVIAAMRPFKVQFTPFWATNRIYIKDGTPALVKILQALPQVREIRAPKLPTFPPLNPIEGTPPNVSVCSASNRNTK